MMLPKVRISVLGSFEPNCQICCRKYSLSCCMAHSYYHYLNGRNTIPASDAWYHDPEDAIEKGCWTVGEWVDGIPLQLKLQAETASILSFIVDNSLKLSDADVYIITFSVMDRDDFDKVEQWLRAMRDGVPFILAGGEANLRDNRKVGTEMSFLDWYSRCPVSYKEGVEAAKRIGAVGYYEYSAHTESGSLEEVFWNAVRCTSTYKYEVQRVSRGYKPELQRGGKCSKLRVHKKLTSEQFYQDSITPQLKARKVVLDDRKKDQKRDEYFEGLRKKREEAARKAQEKSERKQAKQDQKAKQRQMTEEEKQRKKQAKEEKRRRKQEAKAPQSKQPTLAEAVKIEVPDWCCCDISGELMRNPVKTPYGHTYEREGIEEWLRRQQKAGLESTDPNTRQPLTVELLVPDSRLRDAIEDWCREHHYPIPPSAPPLEEDDYDPTEALPANHQPPCTTSVTALHAKFWCDPVPSSSSQQPPSPSGVRESRHLETRY